MPKLAVIFPGIGYTIDKHLLYYSRRMRPLRHVGGKTKNTSVMEGI